MDSPQDTIAAMATPLGQSALGVVRLSGPEALPIVQAIFQPAKAVDLLQAPSHTCHVGKLMAEGPIDQAVITLFRAPASYTGEDIVEISAHGNPYILNCILQACLQRGARLARPGEFTERAFLAGKMDLTQAEAVADLIRAKTDKTHTAAMAQLEGRLARKVRALRDQLVPLLAHIEVGLDHSDEDHPFLSRQELVQTCHSVQREIEELLESGKVGKILREGLRVALIGRPNVGKSSLMNALLKEERAIVTPIPGTTRDTLEEPMNWAGVPVVLTDTAGVRPATNDPVEKLGMERTRQAMEGADVVLCLFDASEPLNAEDEAVLQECLAKPHLWIVNKIDLQARWDLQRLTTLNGDSLTVPVSAKTGEGLERLVKTVTTLAFPGDRSMGELHWLINARHHAALDRADRSIAQAAQAAQTEVFEECVALELRAALQALGEIIGETTTENLLDQIFSNFCVGK